VFFCQKISGGGVRWIIGCRYGAHSGPV